MVDVALAMAARFRRRTSSTSGAPRQAGSVREIATCAFVMCAGTASGHGSLAVSPGGDSRSPQARNHRSRARSPSARAASPSTSIITS